MRPTGATEDAAVAAHRAADRFARLRQMLPSDREGAIAWSFLVIAVGFNAHYLWPEVSINAPKLNDGVLHTMLLQRMITAIRSGQDPTDGWFAPVTIGYPIFHYYQHLPFLLPALFGSVFDVDAATLVNVSSYLLLCVFPLSIYWSMRRIELPRIAGALSALLAPLISTNYLFGFDDNSYVWIGFGMYTQLFGMVLCGPAIAQGYRTLRDGRGYFLSVLLVSAVVLSHLVLGYITLVSLFVFVFIKPTTKDVVLRARRGLMLLGLVALVTSYFLIPVLRDNAYLNRSVFEEQTKYDAFGFQWTMRALIGGRLFDYGRLRVLTVLVAVGFGTSLFRWRDERYRVPAILGVLWLLMYFGRPTWGALIGVATLNTDFYLHRLISGVHLAGILLIGIALAIPWQWALARKSARYLLAPAVITAIVLFPVYRERRDYLQSNERYQAASNAAYNREERDLAALEATLRRQPPGRVYAGLRGSWGNDYRVGEVPMSALLNSDGFDMLGYLFFPFSVNSDIQALFNEQSAEQYNLFNVRYVVAPKDRQFPPWVIPIGDFGRHRLYRVLTTGYFDLVNSGAAFNGDRNSFYPSVSDWLTSGLLLAGQYPRLSFEGDAGPNALPLRDSPTALKNATFENGAPRGTVLSEQIGNNSYAARVRVERASFLMLKETYVPGWHVYIDGHETPPVMLMPSYPAVWLTPGEHSVRFVYEPERYRWALLAVGLLALPAIGLAESDRVRRRIRRLRPRRPTGRGSEPASAVAKNAPPAAASMSGAAPLLEAREQLRASLTALDDRLRANAPGRSAPTRVASTAIERDRSLVGWLGQRVASSPRAALALLIAAAMLVRLPLLPLWAYLPENSLDEYAWKRWMEAIHAFGVLNIFEHANTDYVGYHWVLALLSAIYGLMGNDYTEHQPHPGQYSALSMPLHLLLKAPPLVFDGLLIVAVFAATLALTARRTPQTRSLVLAFGAAAAIAFHPAVVYESAVWAQIDASITASMVGAVLLAARGRPGWAGVCWALGFAIKPQPIVIAPLLLVLVLRREGWRALPRLIGGAALIFAIVVAPWVLHGDARNVYDVYHRVFTSEQYAGSLSSAAWNTWWFSDVRSHPLPQDAIFHGLSFLTYKRAGFALSAIAGAIALAYTWRRPTLRRGLIASAYMAFAFYMLPTSSHERYLYPLLGLLLPVAIVQPRWLWIYVPVSLTFTANLLIVGPPVHDWSGRWVSSPFSLAVAGANVVLFGVMTLAMVWSLLPRRMLAPAAVAARGSPRSARPA